jgi:hypothetical protein
MFNQTPLLIKTLKSIPMASPVKKKNARKVKPAKKKVSAKKTKPAKKSEPDLRELIRQGKAMQKKLGEDSDKLVMRTRDIEIVLECSERTAQRKMTQIRKALKLDKGNPIPVKKFCEYTKLEEADVQRKLKAY